MTAPATAARIDMTQTLITHGDLRTPGWRDAFATVPRELFAPAFSVRTSEGLHAYSASDPEFWDKVYSDDSLITLRDAAGTAISSSSQPSLMARMLEAFTLAPGDRALEIGTGTGYNTALLCHHLGAEQVTSIDIDPRLTGPARERLASIGYQPTIITGDGTAGHPDGGPYNGILATCGVNRIPTAWLDQLAPDGVIVTNIGTGIVRLLGQGDGTVSGRFLPEEAGFMLARPTADHVGATAARYTQLIVTSSGSRTNEALPAAATSDDFFHTLVHPRALEVALTHHDVLGMTLREGESTLHGLIHPSSHSWARIIPGTSKTQVEVTVGGPRNLWSERLDLLLPWMRADRPEPDSYGLSVSSDGTHTLWHEHSGHRSWKLPV